MQICRVLMLLAASALHGVDSFASGPPSSACDDMFPAGHRVAAQETSSPYVISVDQSSYDAASSSRIAVTISGATFRGYFLQARDSNDMRYGTFVETDDDVLNTPCGDDEAAVSHASSGNKTSVTVIWTPGEANRGAVHFRATVVQVQVTFWVGIESAELMEVIPAVTSHPSSNGTTTTTTHQPTPSRTTDSSRPDERFGVSLAGCGTTHGCFTYPPNCRIANCESVAQWSHVGSGETVRFTLQTTKDWVALGFSDDAAMGDDYALQCIRTDIFGLDLNDGVEARSTYNDGHNNRPFNDVEYGLSDVHVMDEDDVITCSVQRAVHAPAGGDQRDLFFSIDQPFTLFLASGRAIGGIATQHDAIPAISTRPITVTSELATVTAIAPLPPSAAPAHDVSVTILLGLIGALLLLQ